MSPSRLTTFAVYLLIGGVWNEETWSRTTDRNRAYQIAAQLESDGQRAIVRTVSAA